jgi:hypothetical protein
MRLIELNKYSGTEGARGKPALCGKSLVEFGQLLLPPLSPEIKVAKKFENVIIKKFNTHVF